MKKINRPLCEGQETAKQVVSRYVEPGNLVHVNLKKLLPSRKIIVIRDQDQCSL